MKILLLIFFTVLFVSNLCLGQTYSTSNYTLEDGLAQNQVKHIAQDKNGYIWFGTYNSGISKFDGNTLSTYSVDNGLASNNIQKMLVDKDSNIWIGSYGNGVSLYDGKTFDPLEKLNKDLGKKVYSIFQDSRGIIYIGTDSGVVSYDGMNVEYLHIKYEKFQRDIIRSIAEDKDGKIYFGGMRYGIAILDKEELSYLNTNNESISAFSLLLDKKNQLIIGSRKGVYLYKNGEITNLSKKFNVADGLVHSLYNDEDGITWIGTTKGLYKFDQLSIKEVFLSGTSNQLGIECFYKDYQNNLWIGTQNAGVFLVKKSVFENYTINDGVTNGYIFAITKYNGAYWFGGHKNGISILKNNQINYLTVLDGLKHERIYSFENHFINNELLIGSKLGVNIYKKGQFVDDSKFDRVDGLKVYDIHVDSKNRTWVCTSDNGLYVFIDNDSSFHYSILREIKSKRVFSMEEDLLGNFWFATNDGIFKISPNQEITSYNEDNGLPNNRCTDVKIDYKNNVWIAHSDGLTKFDGTSFKRYNTTNGLSSASSFFLEIDNNKNLWLGTSKGLNKVDLESLYEKDTFIVKVYDKSNGYIGIESNQKASFVDGDNVWVGSIFGVSKYNPEEEKINLNKPIIHFTELLLNYDQPLPLDKDLVLEYTEKHLTFNYIGLSFYAPEKTKYSFYLEGSSNLKWSPLSNKTTATFVNLSPGDYIFKLKAQNEDGIWSDIKEFKFSITPPFWKTTWFLILMGILIVLGIYLYTSYRTKKLITDKQELETEVQNRTQDLETANSIINKKNKDITDSINYSKRIQSSLMPDLDTLYNTFKNGAFCMYQPKDIISGDFYWLHDFDNVFVCIAADCTGHGVPGALMSMICISQINQHVLSEEVNSPENALVEINNGIVDSLKQEDSSDSNDGMDLAICAFHKKTLQLQYSGAYHPLYIVRHGELLVFKANRLSLGGKKIESEILNGHNIQLQKDDSIYIFSDGFVDQFGGERGKKFMAKRFRELLISINNKAMEEQKNIIEKAFADWKGDLDQVDDVLVIGFKI
ncbi:MAG TPA: hypothetical protein EYG86_06865 [Crocinitomicaceae bacterium]|nr:hypothetical protein [Crocinitomicaceae bacterium]